MDYFYRSPERFEACAELNITISKIEFGVDYGDFKSFDCEQYCARFGLDVDEFTDELKSDLESEIKSLDIASINDGEEEVKLKSTGMLTEYKNGSYYLTYDGRVMQYLGVLIETEYLLFGMIEEDTTMTYEPNGVARANNASGAQSENLNIIPTEVFAAKVRFGKSDAVAIKVKHYNTKAELDAYLEGLSDLDGYSCFEML